MILLSTFMYGTENFKDIFHYVEKYQQIGVEIFPLWHKPEFEQIMEECKERFKKIPVSYHEQYYESEHSVDNTHPLYEKTLEMLEKSLANAAELNSRFFVYHYNNMAIPAGKKDEMLQFTRNRLNKVTNRAKKLGIEVVIENVGVTSHNNVILNEQEFIEECRSMPNKVLFDIGHAWANGWNLENVISSLQDKIVAYHIHNNDGEHDLHHRICKGTLNFDWFMELYHKYTPSADLVLEYYIDTSSDVEGIETDIEKFLNMGF